VVTTPTLRRGKQLEVAFKRCGGKDKLVEIPVYISPIAVTYHLKGVKNLKLTPDTMAKIFTGKITNWNDPAIAKTNPGAKLPNQRITPVHRSDDSDTTGNFTDYLAGAAGKSWSAGMSEKWPSALKGESAQGTSGVVKVVKQTPGAITYADASQVRHDRTLGVVKVKVGTPAPRHLRDVPRQVAHTFQALRGVNRGEDRAQVGGDWRLQRQQGVGALLDLRALPVHRCVPGDHPLREREILLQKCGGGVAHGVSFCGAHIRQVLRQRVQLCVVVLAHEPTLEPRHDHQPMPE
jgi:hypothetical protein